MFVSISVVNSLTSATFTAPARATTPVVVLSVAPNSTTKPPAGVSTLARREGEPPK